MIDYNKISLIILVLSLLVNTYGLYLLVSIKLGMKYTKYREARDTYFELILNSVSDISNVRIDKYVGIEGTLFDLDYSGFTLLFLNLDFAEDFGLDMDIVKQCIADMKPYIRSDLEQRRATRIVAIMLFVYLSISVGNTILNFRNG